MALTQAEIEARITTLEGGLAKLESGTTFADRGTTYVSTDQLLSRISYYKALLRSAAGGSRQTLVRAEKGW